MKSRIVAVLVLLVSLFGPLAHARTAEAQGGCDKPSIALLEARLGKYDQAHVPAYEQMANLELGLARVLLACYKSGRSGGAYSGNTPLEDISEAAAEARSAADDWYQGRDRNRSCSAYKFASNLYQVGASDRTAYQPAALNEPFRKALPVAAAGFQRQQAHYCS